MKKTILSLLTVGLAGILFSAAAQNPLGDTNNPPPPPASEAGPDAGLPPLPDFGPNPLPDLSGTNTVAAETNAGSTVILPSTAKPALAEPIVSSFVPPSLPVGTNQNDLTLNFNRAPLEMVLNYLSDAAGLIIVQDTHVNGNVTVVGKHLTRDEAVDLLNSVLNKNGYAAIRQGRTLTIVDKNDAKTRDIPVKSGNDPAEIPKNAEIVTQIIPIRFVEARQLVSDLTSFVSPQATVVANEAGNSVVITDTQSNIRHLMEIIKAIDSSAEASTEIRVFPLKYASPSDVASELSGVFPSSSSGNTAQAPTRFGGGGGPGGFFARMMGGGGNSGNSSNDRIKKATQVTAVADARIQAVIVTAPKDLMMDIASMMKELDVPSTRDQKVFVFHMNNGDPQQAAQVLQTMFQSGTTSRSGNSSSQNSPLMQRAQNNTTTTSSSSSGSSGFGTGGGGGGRGGAGGLQF